MKEFFRRTLVKILIFMTIFQFIASTPVQAVDVESVIEGAIGVVTSVADGLLGILTWQYKIIILIVEVILMALVGLVARTFGCVDAERQPR